MPYSCAHMATMDVKGLLKENKRKVVWGANGRQRVAYDMEQFTMAKYATVSHCGALLKCTCKNYETNTVNYLFYLSRIC